MIDKIELKNLIEIVKAQIEIQKQSLDDRKNNISKSYYMAKHDFRCIENMEDVVETYSYVLEKLQDCQDRIIERNSINISDLYK